VANWLIQMAGVEISIKAKGGRAIELVQFLLANIPTKETNSKRAIQVSLSFENDEWVLHDKNKKIRRRFNNEGDAAYHLSDRIIFHIADKTDQAHCLHAGSVSYQGQALVIPANSGAGKSTLTTWLVAQGFDYLTDELILVYPDGHIEAIARPIQIKSHGVEPVKPFVVEPALIKKGKIVNAIPVGALSQASVVENADGIALFLFPKYDAESDYQLTELSSADAGMRLMANHVNARNLEGHGFRAMMELIRNTPCYALNYGGFDKLPTDFSHQLQKLLTPKHRRGIRSFVKREGKLTKGQQNAIDELWPRFGVDLENGSLDLGKLFQRNAPTVMEIGFGNGLSFTQMAADDPATNFFGIEVHTPGAGSCLVQVKKLGLKNVRVSMDDAIEVVSHQIADASLDRIQIFFPDPWHKKRHHKRRLLQNAFVQQLVTKLKPGGVLHVATDWENYAEHILEVLTATAELENTVRSESSPLGFSLAKGSPSLAHGCAPKPDYRPNTKYEERGIRLGHDVWDIVFEKNHKWR